VRFEGQDAIRAEFAPMFAGEFGQVRFHVEDAIADASNGSYSGEDTCVIQILQFTPVSGSFL